MEISMEAEFMKTFFKKNFFIIIEVENIIYKELHTTFGCKFNCE